MTKNIILLSLLSGTILSNQFTSTFNIKKAYIQIQGAWAQNDNENVEFIISKKNIEYFESGYIYNYKLTNQKDFIISDSKKVILFYKIISLSYDSLIIQSKNDGNRGLIYKYFKR